MKYYMAWQEHWLELVWEIFFRTNLTCTSVTTFLLSLEYFQKQPPEVFYKNLLKNLQNSLENTCARASFFKESCKPQPCNFIKKETLAQVFSWKLFRRTSFEQNNSEWLLLSTEEQFRDITKFTVDGKSEGNLNQNTLKTFM